jgi:hypothetical protein
MGTSVSPCFKDDNARAVFCVGIPFPSLGDIKVGRCSLTLSHPC